ncbi:MAG: oxygen-dependent coproporphyrinogen oxidase [Sphingopyxis sp.]
MTTLDFQQQAAQDWFESLRTRICAAFEAIEAEAGSDARFDYSAWDREAPGVTPGALGDGGGGGGGVRAVMKGKIFEKVGVNVSTVGGAFSPDFAAQIHGAAEDPSFFATGISLVAHMANPHVPAVHMNTRFLVTTKRWFGGGADLNPPIPYPEDTAAFHARLRAACMPFGPEVYDRYAQWAEEYFFIPHRGVARGVGGIFYDHLECDSDALFERNLAFTKAVGEAFLDAYPPIVRRRMATPFTPEQIHQQRVWRGLYAEFNLVHDRGTLFGLKTGGNIEAILMSLPPMAVWD